MSDWVRVSDTPQIETGTGTTVSVDNVEVAVFRNDEELFAIVDQCPHQGASLGRGSFDGKCVTCPLHSWKFDVTTGAGDRGQDVGRVSVKSEEGGLWVDRDTLPKPAEKIDDGIQRYLIRYGALGWVGLFGTVHELECEFKTRVVLQTHRGLELGEVLTTPSDPQTQQSKEPPTGELLRLAETDEVSKFETVATERLPQLMSESQKSLQAGDVSVDLVDAELLLDGKKAILYYLGDASPQLTDLREPLAAKLGVDEVEWQSLIEQPQPQGCGSGGCSSGGCGSTDEAGGGGCSTGGCSSGGCGA
jgi:nitrite reductase/ring-hydroxylating ferredoxin subunit